MTGERNGKREQIEHAGKIALSASVLVCICECVCMCVYMVCEYPSMHEYVVFKQVSRIKHSKKVDKARVVVNH